MQNAVSIIECGTEVDTTFCRTCSAARKFSAFWSFRFAKPAGPQLPQHMEVGSASGIWLVDGERILSRAEFVNTLGLGPTKRARIRVELHHGRWITTPTFHLPAEMVNDAKLLSQE